MKKLDELVIKKEWTQASAFVKDLNQPKNIELFNLAYLEFKKENFVEAKYLLEKAKYSGLLSEDLNGALGLVREKLEIKEAEESISFYDKVHLTSLSLPSAVFPSIIIAFLLLGVIAIYRKHFVIFTILLCLSGAGLYVYESQKDFTLYIGLEDQSVKLGPSKIFEQLQVLPRGLKYSISKEVKDWQYIYSPKEYQGWIYKTKAIKYELP